MKRIPFLYPLSLAAMLLCTTPMVTAAPQIVVSNRHNGVTERLTLPGFPGGGPRREAAAPDPQAAARPCNCSPVEIATVSTELLDDLDDDGFYSRFSVHFDANTAPGERIWLYAKLYLSLEGGPWTLYATSDDFLIEEDSLLDDYLVETTLHSGFPAGYYDVRIELYDADSDTWVYTYGPYDDGSLRDLPLEDEERDRRSYVAIDYHVHASGGGGALDAGGLLLLLLPGVAALRRRIQGRDRRPSPGGDR